MKTKNPIKNYKSSLLGLYNLQRIALHVLKRFLFSYIKFSNQSITCLFKLVFEIIFNNRFVLIQQAIDIYI